MCDKCGYPDHFGEKLSSEPTLPNIRQFVDLVQRADAYILALRRVVYARQPEVRKLAEAQLNELGSYWYAARESCASDIPEPAGSTLPDYDPTESIAKVSAELKEKYPR